MERTIEVLDCTLRDGGRAFLNIWGDKNIDNISKGLKDSRIDIVEIGYLYYITQTCLMRGGRAIFTSIDELKPFLQPNQKYVALLDYSVYKKKFFQLPISDGALYGIRLAILKDEIDESINFMKEIKEKGYKLLIQAVEIISYSDEELIYMAKKINEVKPHSIGIADTYGSMYIEDLKRIYKILDENIDKDISIDFHGHDNIKLSFALALTLIEIAKDRNLVIDSTLAGVGMGAGNLPTEIICRYLNDKHNKNYKINSIVNLIDKYINVFKQEYVWNSDILSYESAIEGKNQYVLSYIKNQYSNLDINDNSHERTLCLLRPNCQESWFPFFPDQYTSALRPWKACLLLRQT